MDEGRIKGGREGREKGRMEGRKGGREGGKKKLRREGEEEGKKQVSKYVRKDGVSLNSKIFIFTDAKGTRKFLSLQPLKRQVLILGTTFTRCVKPLLLKSYHLSYSSSMFPFLRLQIISATFGSRFCKVFFILFQLL